ncbi:unnamed protein product [Staurois parvus]|uniref:Uncharacterized protein n=1 Tax=Staurois parvus TaxID=386267 RepID=A0ABN9DXH9_9NEOB|nr:unnamed protein product [Staurois parvus]
MKKKPCLFLRKQYMCFLVILSNNKVITKQTGPYQNCKYCSGPGAD